MAADVIYTSSLDDSEVIASLDRMRAGFKEVGRDGTKAFQEIAKEADKALDAIDKKATKVFNRFGKRGKGAFSGVLGSALKTGAVMGVVASAVDNVIDAVVELGAKAAQSFIRVIGGSIKLNEEAELLTISLTQIFQGNKEAADAFLGIIKESAIRLGVSRKELAGFTKGILPDVGSIEGAVKLAEQFVVLGRDAGQSFQSIRIAAEEALSGNLSSLQRRLNLPPDVIARVESLAENMGLAAALTEGLQEKIDKAGLSIEATAGSFAIMRGQVMGIGEEFQQQLGVAALEELKEQTAALLETFAANEGEIEDLAETLGLIVANVIEFIGTGLNDFLASLDFERAQELADALFGLVDAGRLLVDVLADADANEGVEDLTVSINRLTGALEGAAKVAARIKATLAGFDFDIGGGTIGSQIGRRLASGEDLFSQERFNESLRDSLTAFDDFNTRSEEFIEVQEARKEVTEDNTAAQLAQAEAALQLQKAEEEVAKAGIAAAEAEATIAAKRLKTATAGEEKLTALALKQERQRIDDALKAAQKREDIARKNVEAIDDIFSKNADAISDAAKDLSRDEEDIARKSSSERQVIEREEAQRKLDTERNFRRELQKIRDQFLQSAADAERNNDVQAFLSAVRRRDEAIEDAKQARTDENEDAQQSAKDQRRALKDTRERDIEGAKITNRRKLEDLQTNLERELEAQRQSIERQFQVQTIAEERQAEMRRVAADRDLADFNTRQASKLAALELSLAKELAVIEEFEKKKVELARLSAEAEARARRPARLGGDRGASTRGSRRGRSGRRREGVQPIGLADGGRFASGDPIKVGERGTEFLIPDQPGVVIPTNVMASPPTPGAMGASQTANTTNDNRSFTLADSMLNDPIERQKLETFILATQLGRV